MFHILPLLHAPRSAHLTHWHKWYCRLISAPVSPSDFLPFQMPYYSRFPPALLVGPSYATILPWPRRSCRCTSAVLLLSPASCPTAFLLVRSPCLGLYFPRLTTVISLLRVTAASLSIFIQVLALDCMLCFALRLCIDLGRWNSAAMEAICGGNLLRTMFAAQAETSRPITSPAESKCHRLRF
jgi:hypothetical protein